MSLFDADSSPHPLEELSHKFAPPIQVENVSIDNPNDIDKWIVATLDAKDKALKTKIFFKALSFGNTLSDKYKTDFKHALVRAIREQYFTLADFFKAVISVSNLADGAPKIMSLIRAEQTAGKISTSDIETLIEHVQKSPESMPASEMLLEKIKALATELAQRSKGMDRKAVEQDIQLIQLANTLREAIKEYQQKSVGDGKTTQEVSLRISQVLDSTGLSYEKKAQDLGARIKGFNLSSPNVKWENAIGDIVQTEANAPEIIDAVREKLSVPESELVFRMMSEQELQKALETGVIGGEVIQGQVESGVTWWGDKLGGVINLATHSIKEKVKFEPIVMVECGEEIEVY